MLLVVCTAYIAGILIEKYYNKKKIIASLFILFCISILAYFKYSNFAIKVINELSGSNIEYLKLVVPVGLSFYTFQAISYVADIYRGVNKAQNSFWRLALYLSFFANVTAGPIVKYHDAEKYLYKRQESLDNVIIGTKLFIVGLSKKVLLANVVGKLADDIFSAGAGNIDLTTAWLGAIAYTFQIFFDFSGYSDMAIGLGRIFGFHFIENFNYPYISKSITEFWRRWHISLSTWFKEYLYISLGGNRCGQIKTYRNLFLVFLATGIWHGANWTFLLWGIWHGIFIVLEKKFGSIRINIIARLYTMLAVILGWVLFRADNFIDAVDYIKVMFGLSINKIVPFDVSYYLSNKIVICLLLCTLFSMPIAKFVEQKVFKLPIFWSKIVEDIALFILLFLSIIYISGSTYSPFIYFKF